MFSTRTALDLGAMASLSLAGAQASSSPALSNDFQNIVGSATIVLSIAAIVYGIGRTVERFQQRGDQNRSKLVNDDQRFREIQDVLSKILDRLTGLEKDLIGRRALVDKEVTVLTMGVASLERRAGMIESRHNRLRDKFNVVIGSLAPVLKDMDADFTRNGVMGRIFTAIDENESDSSSGESMPEPRGK